MESFISNNDPKKLWLWEYFQLAYNSLLSRENVKHEVSIIGLPEIKIITLRFCCNSQRNLFIFVLLTHVET